jgi:hypothetical protein
MLGRTAVVFRETQLLNSDEALLCERTMTLVCSARQAGKTSDARGLAAETKRCSSTGAWTGGDPVVQFIRVLPVNDVSKGRRNL